MKVGIGITSVLLRYRDANFMANSVNLLRNSRKVFPLQNFGNETYDLPKLQKYSVETAFVSRLCDLNLEFQGRTNNVKKQKLWKIYFRTLLLRFIFSFSFLLSRSANFLSLMKFAVEEAKSELNRIGKRRNVFVGPKKVCSETSALHFLAFIKGGAHQQTETCEKLPDHILNPFLILVSLALYSDNLDSCPKPYISFFYSPRISSAQNSSIFHLSLIVTTSYRLPYVCMSSRELWQKNFKLTFPHYCLELIKVVCRNMSSTKHVNWLRLYLFQHEKILKCELSRESNSFLYVSIISQRLTWCE